MQGIVTQLFGTGDATVWCPAAQRMVMVYHEDAALAEAELVPGAVLDLELDNGRVVAIRTTEPEAAGQTARRRA